jgi:hypothetical protein
MKQPNSIYFYKMTTDNGGAPCVHKSVLSLSICKPKIRRTAKVGDLVFGFGGKELEERLIYAAFVTKKLEGGAYYKERRYCKRPDCIYRSVRGRAKIKTNAQFHSEGEQLNKDVGKLFKKADVLLSKDFRYLGAKGTTKYQKRYKNLTVALDILGQGHRVNHRNKVRKELCQLAKALWKEKPQRRVKPSDSELSQPCNRGTRPVRC